TRSKRDWSSDVCSSDLCTSPEWVGLSGHVNNDQWVLIAIFPLNSAGGGGGGLGQELATSTSVLKDHRVVIRVDFFLHNTIPSGLKLQVGSSLLQRAKIVAELGILQTDKKVTNTATFASAKARGDQLGQSYRFQV